MNATGATSKRDGRFIAVHRGGLLTDANHRALMRWALASARHLLRICPPEQQAVIEEAFGTAERWADGDATTGEAMTASRGLHRRARSARCTTAVYCYRIAAHTLAAAHMADHAFGPLYYGRKLFLHLDRPFDGELSWIHRRLHTICPQMEEAVICVLNTRFSIQLCGEIAETSR